jgi:hypothetical protein
LAARPKGNIRKVRLARRLRTGTSVTWKWIWEHELARKDGSRLLQRIQRALQTRISRIGTN